MSSHVIFGAGLIGGYLGGILRVNYPDVTFVCREANRIKWKEGLTLTDFNDSNVNIPPLTFADDQSPDEYCDFLWLTVKCTGIKSAIDDMVRFVGPHTHIFCCQNGLGSDAAIRLAFPNNSVSRVMVPFNVVALSAQRLHRGSAGEMVLELSEKQATSIQSISQRLHCDMLPTKTSTDMHAVLWAKLQLNLGNAINALADIPVKEMLEQRDYRRVIAMLMEELLGVCHAQRISLPALTRVSAKSVPRVLRLPDWLFKRVASAMLEIDPHVRTSMWWDLNQRKATEIDYLNGAVVRAGEAAGVATPANAFIVKLVRDQERINRSNSNRAVFSAAQLRAQISQLM